MRGCTRFLREFLLARHRWASASSGLQVVTSSGGQLSFGQATVRHFMKFLSLFTGSVGFMMAGWTKRRQALHDMPSDSIVVRVAEPSLSLFGFRA